MTNLPPELEAQARERLKAITDWPKSAVRKLSFAECEQIDERILQYGLEMAQRTLEWAASEAVKNGGTFISAFWVAERLRSLAGQEERYGK